MAIHAVRNILDQVFAARYQSIAPAGFAA